MSCLNSDCPNFNKKLNKIESDICPICGESLISICNCKGCLKSISTAEKYCDYHRAINKDKKEKIWNGVKTYGGIALGVAAAIVTVVSMGNKAKDVIDSKKK